jgi:queuine tRNA-ribosyltransferase
MAFSFQITDRDPESRCRLGKLSTTHGEVETPAFMPVGTRGVVKAVSPHEIRDMGYRMILANAYHLYLRPGHELISRHSGLHNFMGWDGAILTDSGGFQVFSLAHLRKVSDEGVMFQSHLDGSSHMFTPELSVQVQEALGVDIIMCLDDVRGYPITRPEAEEAVERTSLWARRSVESKKKVDPGLFGIVQGSSFSELRRLSAESLTSLGLDGYAIGGLSVGEPREIMIQMMEVTTPYLPEKAPRYLMGVGKPQDILEAVLRGIDLFDCVLPTRNARNGTLFTSGGTLNMRNARHRDDPQPIDPTCECPLCREYSRAYLRHLFMEKEIYGIRLATIHNLTFYSNMMVQIRKSVKQRRLGSFVKDFLGRMEDIDD